MRTKNIILQIAVVTFITMQLLIISSIQVIANTNPVVTNIFFTISGTTVTIKYNIKDAEQTSVSIQMYVSENNGVNWDDKTNEATGDVNTVTGITTTSTQKTINWTYSGGNESTMVIKLFANDLTAGGDSCIGVGRVYYEGGPNNDGADYYNTILIGNQCWFKENLNVGTKMNSSSIYDDQGDNGIIEKYCYDNKETYCDTYGGLYQWDEAMQHSTGEFTQGICPTGWRIPTNSELLALGIAAANSSNAIKAVGTGTGAGVGTNTSGFSSIFAGYRNGDNGGFRHVSTHNYFWSSSQHDYSGAYHLFMVDNNDSYSVGNGQKHHGFNVRCIKN